MISQIEKLEIVPLRDAFPHEARHFTVWLESKIEALGARIGLKLKDVKREVKVGDFSLDLRCKDHYDRDVIIENQLERSNHDHLGKLLVYLVNLNAKVGIWVVSEARYEHEQVIHWLNQITPADSSFYLIKVEAVRIGNSPYAPLFTVIAGPDAQAKIIGENIKHNTERDRLWLLYWEQFLEICKTRNNRYANKTPSKDNWLAFSTGIGGITFDFVSTKNTSKIELYIDWDQNTGTGNKQLFDLLKARKVQIETALDKELLWERLDNRRACRISSQVAPSGLSQPDHWSSVHLAMVSEMERFEAVLKPELEQAKVGLRLNASTPSG